MRQFRVTTADLTPSSNEDCYISPEDPIWDLIPSSQLGGLGSNEALANYNRLNLPSINTNDKGKIAREQGLEPGTEAWFKHWFGDKR